MMMMMILDWRERKKNKEFFIEELYLLSFIIMNKIYTHIDTLYIYLCECPRLVKKEKKKKEKLSKMNEASFDADDDDDAKSNICP